MSLLAFFDPDVRAISLKPSRMFIGKCRDEFFVGGRHHEQQESLRHHQLAKTAAARWIRGHPDGRARRGVYDFSVTAPFGPSIRST